MRKIWAKLKTWWENAFFSYLISHITIKGFLNFDVIVINDWINWEVVVTMRAQLLFYHPLIVSLDDILSLKFNCVDLVLDPELVTDRLRLSHLLQQFIHLDILLNNLCVSFCKDKTLKLQIKEIFIFKAQS